MKVLAFIFALMLLVSGCTMSAVTLKSPNGQSVLTDSSPLDSEWTLISGTGCTIPNAPAQPATPVVISEGKLMSAPPAPACNVQYAKAGGVGVSGFIGGLLSLGAGIKLLVGGL